MNLDIKIEGLPKALLKLRLLDQEVRKAVEIAMGQAALLVQRRAHENISGMHGHKRHVKTGNLRRNIKSKVGWSGPYQIDGVIGTDVPYAPHVEALPDGGYLYPALMETGREALKFFQEKLIIAVKGVAE